MTELQLYGPGGYFHNVVKASQVMNGRYQILTTGNELNRNNLLSGLDLPTENYPGVFCLPPISVLKGNVTDGWECFYFRLLFLCTTYYTGDNKTKSPDLNTNSSLHTVPMDWNDMKRVALSFMYAVERIRVTGFRLQQGEQWRVARVSDKMNNGLSGVLMQFEAAIFNPCDFDDIDYRNVSTEFAEHENHFH